MSLECVFPYISRLIRVFRQSLQEWSADVTTHVKSHSKFSRDAKYVDS